MRAPDVVPSIDRLPIEIDSIVLLTGVSISLLLTQLLHWRPSALLTHVLVARSAAELGECAVEGGRLVKAQPALAARAAAALRAVALAALSEMGAPAAPRGEGIEAAAAQFVAAQRAILERVANPS